MKCARCQHENGPGARFCEECASPLARACASCGTALSPTAKFCPECARPAAQAGAGRFAAPEAYTPRHLAERVLTSKAALEGERKHVSVLFADLKASMELFADRDPEEARRLLDPVLERMMEAVHHYEGTVNQVMGDGVMALFGAPVTHEDHAVRACYAGLRMQESIKRYAEEVHRTVGVPLHIRVGVNSGEVVVRSIGSDLRMDYTAVGQTTNVAARLEQMAMPGTILISPRTVKLAEGYVMVKSLGPRPVKGLDDPLEVFEILGAGTVRSRLQATAARGLTRFVGRATEVEQLQDALDRASRGHGQVVAVVGEPGVGKSRLFWEVIHSHCAHGWLIVQSASVSYGKSSALLPLIALLRGYFEIDSRDDVRAIRERVTRKVLTLAPALGSAVPAFLALLDVPVDEPTWQSLEPSQRRQQTLDAVKRLLLRESEVQPLVVVLEDLHWIDGETQTVLDSLVESLPAARLLLLVNYRPEYSHGWGGKTYYRQVRIDPLPRDSADELLEALLGTDAALGPLKRRLIERTDANPFFLEESVHALVETGALAGERGAYRLTRPVEQLTIPATVQAILAARIDRLGPEGRRLLQAAAVIGKDVPLPLLLAIADAPEADVRAELTRLQAAEFLYETRLFPDFEYTFKHALTQDVAYGELLLDRKRALHARIAEALEGFAGERVAEQAERLAYHALRGELWEKAIAYLRQAGVRAMARSAHREAIAHLDQALETVGHLPESQAKTELTIDIHLDLRNALLPLSDHARIGEHLHAADALARALGDQQRLGRIATFMVAQFVNAGEYDEALRFGQEALSIVRARGDRSSEVVVTTFLGQPHAARGEFRDAATFLERNVALEGDLRYERFGTPGIQSAFSGAWLADVLSQLGRFDEAIGHAEAAVKIADEADNPFTLTVGLLDLGVACLRRGDLLRSIQVLERCLDLSRTSRNSGRTFFVAATLGAAYALGGRVDDALALVASLEDLNSSIHIRPAVMLVRMGMIYLLAGRTAEAGSYAREALALARRLGARGSEADALCLAGDVASAGGTEDGEGRYRAALALAGQLGMRPLTAHCHLGLGKLFRHVSKRQQAREHFTAAAALYREMDMRFWLELEDIATTRVAPRVESC